VLADLQQVERVRVVVDVGDRLSGDLDDDVVCAKTRLRPDRSTIGGVFDAMASGDGRLATEAGSGPPDRYRCDPADP
jgi:hypothetical protein